MGNSVWKSSLKNYLPYTLFRGDKLCYLIGQYIHHLYKRDILTVINQSTICVFTIFLWLRITIVALVLQLIWYYSTSWVSNIGDLVLVLIFWFRIIKCGWFSILGIIASNFLKMGNGWAIVVNYTTILVYVGTHFFLQFLENSRSHSNVYNLISSKN